MIRCICTWHIFGVLLVVTFPDHPGQSLALQGDDIRWFAQNCGVRDDDLEDLEAYEDITECLDDYLTVAQAD